jgi:hypothetical protein
MSKPYLTESSKPPASNAESIKCVWACLGNGPKEHTYMSTWRLP